MSTDDERTGNKVAYFDTFSGASGDMILASLLDAGLSLDELRAGLAKLPLEGCAVRAEPVRKGGLAATAFFVDLSQGDAAHRDLADVNAIIDDSSLSAAVKDKAKRVFARLAEAEAAAHGVPVGEVHFHEVGAVDCIVDVVGTAAALELLGIEKVVSGPLRFGQGTIRAAHGVLPVPAPATARLAEGFPVEHTDLEGELTTPTGAAILTALADSFGPPPPMTLEATGFGAGQADRPGRANVLRVLIGREAPSEPGRVAVLEASIDDTSPEVLAYACEELLGAGALDAFTAPIQMKKSRPGALLTVIARPEDRPKLEAILFRETTTLGVRWREQARTCLERQSLEVEVLGSAVSVKVGLLGGEVVSVSPEYEPCARLAREKGIPLREVYAAARRAAAKSLG